MLLARDWIDDADSNHSAVLASTSCKEKHISIFHSFFQPDFLWFRPISIPFCFLRSTMIVQLQWSWDTFQNRDNKTTWKQPAAIRSNTTQWHFKSKRNHHQSQRWLGKDCDDLNDYFHFSLFIMMISMLVITINDIIIIIIIMGLQVKAKPLVRWHKRLWEKPFRWKIRFPVDEWVPHRQMWHPAT